MWPLPCFDTDSEYRGGPSGNQSRLFGLRGQAFRQRQICHWRQLTMTYRQAWQPVRVWQTTAITPQENSHSHLFLCSYNNPVDRSFIFSLGTSFCYSFSDFISSPSWWFQFNFQMRHVMFSFEQTLLWTLFQWALLVMESYWFVTVTNVFIVHKKYVCLCVPFWLVWSGWDSGN